MKYLKDYGMLCLKFFIFFMIGSLITSVLYYFLVSQKVVYVISMIYLGLVFFLFSYKAGKKANSKGFLAGLKLGGLFVGMLFLMSLVVNGFHFKLFQFAFYFIMVGISVVAATLGINKKK